MKMKQQQKNGRKQQKIRAATFHDIDIVPIYIFILDCIFAFPFRAFRFFLFI